MRKRILLILLLIWIFKEYRFNIKIKNNERRFLLKKKKSYLEGIKLDKININNSELINCNIIRNIFPFKEFYNFITNSSSQNIDVTLSQLFYASSLSHVDNETIYNGIKYYICNEYELEMTYSAKETLKNYITDILKIIRKKIPIDDGITTYKNDFFKIKPKHFPIYHSWIVCKTVEYLFKIQNSYCVFKFGLNKYTKNDVDIYYKLTGKQNIVLIFGGIIGNIASISTFMDTLNDFDIIYPVFPITNKSIDHDFENITDIDDYLELIDEFMLLKNIYNIHVIGWSFGGLLSYNFISKYTSYNIVSQFIVEGLGIPFSCITSTMLINESFTNSLYRLISHVGSKYLISIMLYSLIFKIKSIQWTSYILTPFRNIVWTDNLWNRENVTMYFSKHDFLMPVDIHRSYIDSLENANKIIDNGNHGYYIMSDKFYNALMNHFNKYRYIQV